MGTLLPERTRIPEDRKSVILLLVGLVLAGTGASLIIYTPALAIVFPSNWWIYTLLGAALFICGILLASRSRVYRASLDG
ncbi:MAG: hypothetical protein ACE5H4_12890 [Candidatus Thorarchaeota archaeon]